MPSKILYNKSTKEILRCQPEPKGSAKLPSFNSLCKSARVTEDEKEYLDTIVINGDYLTSHIQDNFKIVELDSEIQIKKKPKVIITPSTTELDTSVNNILTININIQDILTVDNITSVAMRINNVNFTIDITDSTGSKDIELNEVDTYEIDCTEDRFVSKPVTVEVV